MGKYVGSIEEMLCYVKRIFNREQKAIWGLEETLYRVLNAGPLDIVATGTYSFCHQTFQEYLVASAENMQHVKTNL